MATAIAPEEVLTSNQLTSQWTEAWWQRWQTAQTLVTESATNTVNTLTQAGETAKTTLLTATDQAIAKISDAATRAVTTIHATADRETQSLTDTAQQATTAVIETTDRAKVSITEITQMSLQAVERVNSATAQQIHRLTEATDQATIALNNRWQSAGMRGTMIDVAQDAIANSVQTWLDAHPIIGWFIIHPLILIATILLLIWLSWGLFRAIAQLSERLWIGLLRAPFQLLGLCWQLATRLLQRSNSEPQPALPDEPNKQEKLATLLARLEDMRREQDELLKEVQMMLKD
jgi:DNA uptake protein ComE-like DNA-binding protein